MQAPVALPALIDEEDEIDEEEATRSRYMAQRGGKRHTLANVSAPYTTVSGGFLLCARISSCEGMIRSLMSRRGFGGGIWVLYVAKG